MAATSNAKMPKSVPVEVKTYLSIGEEMEVMNVSIRGYCMDPIISYSKKRVVPIDKKQTKKLRFQAIRYMLIDGVLYK